jgi:hypothetical protein
MNPTMPLRAFATVFGMLMVAATGIQPDGLGLAAAALAALAVLASIQIRVAATLAVLLAVSVIVIYDPPPVFAALSGLCATAYLVLRHAVGSPAGVTATPPTIIAAVGFTIAGLVAALFPFQVPWLPLLAPAAVFGIFVLATHPLLGVRDRSAR